MKFAPLAVVALGWSLAGSSLALAQRDATAAESSAPAPETFAYGEFELMKRGFIRVPIADAVAVDPDSIDPDQGEAHGGPPSRILYLNNCKPSGCPVTPGNFTRNDDSRINLSSIVRPVAGDTQPYDPRTLAAYSGSDATWAQIVACVRENYAPFNIQVVTTDPGPSVSHFEAFAAGVPSNVGFSSGVAGVASFSCGVIPNAISFSFLNINPNDVLDACWTISQESAHNFGLSHEMLGADAMTYITNPARKRFVNQTACIGTQGCCQPAQECQCGPQEQNSYQELLQIFGPAGATPPTIVIEEPLNNASVQPGFVVRAAVSDDNGVARVELLIDDTSIASLTTGPFAFNAPLDITPGRHTVGIRATDTIGTDAMVSVIVNVGDPCEGDQECAAVGAGYVCVDGRCVPGGGVPGGLGDDCTGPADCLSGMCASKDGENKCSESCNPGNAGGCGDGFECLDTGGGNGLCWPGSDETCAGCDSSGGTSSTPTLPIGAGLLLSALLLVRRRRAA